MALAHRPPTATDRRWVGAPAYAMRDLPWLTWVPVATMSTLLVAELWRPDVVSALAWPLAAAGAVVGVPHGAVDHLVPRWWRDLPDAGARAAAPGRRGAPRQAAALAAFVLAYAAVAAAALAGLLLAPAPMLAVALVLSALHFGRGEVVTAAERAGRTVPPALSEAAVTVAHGAVVVGLLLWSRPADTDPVLRVLSPALADLSAAGRPVGLALVGVALAGGLVSLLRRGRRQDAAELALLAAAFWAAPPAAAFGLYFGAWHALRHTGRLLDLARARRAAVGASDGWLPAAGLLARAGLVPSLAALATVAVLWLTRDVTGVAAQVAVLLALTFPHAVVVAALDRREARSGPAPGTGVRRPLRRGPGRAGPMTDD